MSCRFGSLDQIQFVINNVGLLLIDVMERRNWLMGRVESKGFVPTGASMQVARPALYSQSLNVVDNINL